MNVTSCPIVFNILHAQHLLNVPTSPLAHHRGLLAMHAGTSLVVVSGNVLTSFNTRFTAGGRSPLDSLDEAAGLKGRLLLTKGP